MTRKLRSMGLDNHLLVRMCTLQSGSLNIAPGFLFVVSRGRVLCLFGAGYISFLSPTSHPAESPFAFSCIPLRGCICMGRTKNLHPGWHQRDEKWELFEFLKVCGDLAPAPRIQQRNRTRDADWPRSFVPRASLALRAQDACDSEQ